MDQYAGDSSLLDEAQSELTEAIQVDPKNAAAYLELARLQMKSAGISDPRLLQSAADLIAKALEINPSFGNAYVLQGYVFTHQGRFEEANHAFEQAKQFAADSPWLDCNAAELMESSGKAREALSAYEKVAKSPSTIATVRSTALEGLARLYAMQNQFEQAKGAYLRLFQVNPNNAWAMGNYSSLLRRRMLEVDESELWGRRALAKMNYGFGRENLGLTLYLKWAEALVIEKDEVKAEKYFKEAKSYYDEPGELLHELALYPHEHPIVEALRLKGYSLDHFAGLVGGDVPLGSASSQGNDAIVRQLIKAGANPNQPGFQGATPLMLAAIRNRVSTVKLLISLGANPWTLSVENDDAEALARKRGFAEVAGVIADAKTKTPPVAAVDTLRTRDAPFRAGYLYRVKKEISPKDGWGVNFAVGEELVYSELLAYTDQNIAGFQFIPVGSPHFKDWAVPREKIDVWVEYFDEIGPWSEVVK